MRTTYNFLKSCPLELLSHGSCSLLFDDAHVMHQIITASINRSEEYLGKHLFFAVNLFAPGFFLYLSFYMYVLDGLWNLAFDWKLFSLASISESTSLGDYLFQSAVICPNWVRCSVGFRFLTSKRGKFVFLSWSDDRRRKNMKSNLLFR